MAGHDSHLVGRGFETGFNNPDYEAGFGGACGGRNCARVFVVFSTRGEQQLTASYSQILARLVSRHKGGGGGGGGVTDTKSVYKI